MKTLTFLLLALSASTLFAQQTLPAAPPVETRLASSGDLLVSAGERRNAALACFLGAAFVAGATGNNEATGKFTTKQARGWYVAAGLVLAVGVTLEIGGNGKMIRAGKTLRGDQTGY